MAKQVFYRQYRYEQASHAKSKGTKFDTAWFTLKHNTDSHQREYYDA